MSNKGTKGKLEDPSSRFLIYCESLLDTFLIICRTLLSLLIGLIPVTVIILQLPIPRLLVTSLAKVFHKRKFVKPLDLVATFCANVDDIYNSPFNTLVGGFVLQGTPDIEKIRSIWRDKFLHKLDENDGNKFYPELMQTVEYFCGFPFWVQIDEDREQEILEKCVRFGTTEEGETYTSASLTAFLKKISLLPFSKGLPLWQLLILPNYIPTPGLNEGTDHSEPHFIFILRIHHCVADGISTMSLLENFAESPTLAPLKMYRGDQSFLGKVKTTLRLVTLGPFELSRFFFRQTCSTQENILWGNVSKSCSILRGEDRLSAGFSRRLNMDDISGIKLTYGVRGMSVVLCAVLRAVRRTSFLDTLEAIPSVVQCTIPLPTSAHDGRLRNRFTFGAMFLPFDVEDPVQHLLEINSVFQQYSTSVLPTIHAFAMRLGGMIPQPVMRFATRLFTASMDGITISSVPGPKKLETMFGYPFKHLSMCAGLVINQRFPMIYFISCGGQAYIVDVADKQVIPDDGMAQGIIEGFLVEIATLKLCKHEEC